ncbi:LuxR C-terminal-related transcriptional regulator [Paenalcaligenes niemegkensis]|uniref:response regulator transcription factor n=1 Tax=Paenalcaligenes niemegkensis TaxID=2895469 RepID=UPI001EE8466A|nr:LuxR C-terminal-related transcriptional regulator [Paenalcaligenes niemegkensis]MCQ9616453.1 LuxR C-terminal-related transcriptional regulator [Paenalcaligenes niemegkensis]
MTTILVVEPHPLLRLGLLQVLAEIGPGIRLRSSDYSDFRGTEAQLQQCDLLLLAVPDSPEASAVVEAAIARYAPAAILLLSDHPPMNLGSTSLPGNVVGHLSKDASLDILQASFRLVLAGGSCFPLRSPTLSQPQRSYGVFDSVPGRSAASVARVATTLTHRLAKEEPQNEALMLGLTPRQYEVLVLLARGLPLKAIGKELKISAATAKAHTETLYQRLDVHNRNEAVFAALSRGAQLGMDPGQEDD